MGTRDASAAMRKSQISPCVCVRRGSGRMTTEKMQVFSLEEGDQIVLNGNIYRIVDIEDGDARDYRLVLVDEEGYRRSLEADAEDSLRLVLDNPSEN
jgi:HJR/Mrr/RecB family endonuclease